MKSIKKNVILGLTLVSLGSSLTSCATVLYSPTTASQKRKPLPHEEPREVRTGALIADIVLFWPGTLIDLATGALYKPQRLVVAQRARTTQLVQARKVSVKCVKFPFSALFISEVNFKQQFYQPTTLAVGMVKRKPIRQPFQWFTRL